MAIVHDLGNVRDRLEFPAGTALHEASGYLSNPRVSPDGSRVAFVEHQRPLRRSRLGQGRRSGREGDDADRRVVRRAGAGVDARRFDASSSRATPPASSMLQPMSVPASGGAPAQPVFGVPGPVHRLRRRQRRAMAGGSRGSRRSACAPACRARTTERDLSWIGSTGARALSADGGWLLMVDVGPRGGRNYGVVLRKTDASQAIRLGEGLRPEALARRQVGRGHHRGAGAARALSHRARRRDSRRHRADREPHLGRMVPGRQTAARVRLGGRRVPPAATASTAPDRRRRRSRPRACWPRWRPMGRRCCSRWPTAGSQLSSIDGGPTQAGPRAAVRRPSDCVEPRRPGGLRATGRPGARRRRARRARDRRALHRARELQPEGVAPSPRST